MIEKLAKNELLFFVSRQRSTELPAKTVTKTTWPISRKTQLFAPYFKVIKPSYLYQTYEFHGVIASGAFGTVYRVVDRNERKVYALKVLQKSQVIYIYLAYVCKSFMRPY